MRRGAAKAMELRRSLTLNEAEGTADVSAARRVCRQRLDCPGPERPCMQTARPSGGAGREPPLARGAGRGMLVQSEPIVNKDRAVARLTGQPSPHTMSVVSCAGRQTHFAEEAAPWRKLESASGRKG